MSRSKQTSPGAALFQQESDKSLGANTLDDHQRIRQRPRRVRAHTLVAGSPFHTAFFGNDETLRDGFDCEQVASSFCNNRRNSREHRNRAIQSRQNSDLSTMSSESTDTTSSSSSRSSVNKSLAYKQGRPLVPRYGSF